MIGRLPNDGGSIPSGTTKFNAAKAQLEEQLPTKEKDVGSNPISRTSLKVIHMNQEIERQAKLMYTYHIDNHPTIHSNRFPSWSELSEETKDQWRRRVERDI